MGSSTAELGRALDAATPTFDLERIVDALKATERSAPDAIGGAGERSSYQIMQPTFHGIRRLRPDLPEIQFSDLSKPENEETARQYAKAIVEDIASRSPDPKDIAAGYNSGKTARNAPHVTKTDYVPRFLRALGSVLSPGEAQAAEPGSDEARLGAALDAAKVEPEDEARLGAALDVGGEAPIPAQAVVDYYAGPDASFGMGALGTIADSPLGVAEQFLFKHAEIPLLETLAGKDSPAAENARKRFAEQQALIGEGQQAAGIIRERGGAQSLGLRALGVGATIAPAMLAPQTLLSVPGFAATGAVTGAMRPFTGPEDGTAMDALKGAATEGGMNAVTALLFGGAGRLGAAAFPGSRTAQIGSQALVGGIQGGVMEGPQGAFENALLGVPFGMVSNTRPGLKGAPLKERLAEVVNPLSDLLPFSTGLQRRQLGVSQNLQFADTTLPGSLGHERTPTVGDLKAAGKTNTEILAAIGVQNQARSAGAPAEAARGIDTFLEQFGRPLTTEQFKTQAVFNPDWKAFDVPFGEHPVERQGGQTGTYYQSSQVRGLIERATKVTQAVDPALVEIAGANHQTLEAALTRLAAEKQAAGPRSTTEQILDNVVIRRKKPLQQEEQAAVDDGIKVAEETGAAPEGYGKLVEGVSDAEQLVAEAVAARGGTMITSESVPNAMLPPAGMLNVDLNSLSKVDLLIALDQFPALARLRNPAVMMNSNPLTGKAYEELQISDHQKRILLHGGETGEGWVQAFQRALTTPRKFIPKLLPVEDLIAIGKALDGREDGKALVASRPDLIPRVEALRGCSARLPILRGFLQECGSPNTSPTC